MENRESRTSEKNEQRRYYRRLLELGLVDEIREGLDISEIDYKLVYEKETFLLGITLGPFTRYVASPMFIDSFATHDKNRGLSPEDQDNNDLTDRINAFNKTDIHAEPSSRKFYFLNRLRLNRVASVVEIIKQLKGRSSRNLPAEFNQFISQSTLDLEISNYNNWSNEQKITFVEALTEFVKDILNKMVECKMIEGPIL